MTNEPIEVDGMTYQEFMSLAMQNKITLIDHLAAKMLAVGSQAALASAEYYRVKLAEKGDPRLAELAATRAALEGEYDALKHAVSALQSTLRAEREMDK